MTSLQIIALPAYILLQAIGLRLLYKKIILKSNGTLKTKTIYRIGFFIYLAVNILLIATIFFYNFILSLNNHYFKYIVLGVLPLAFIFSLPALYLIITSFWSSWLKKSNKHPTDFSKRRLLKKTLVSSIAIGIPLTYFSLQEKENLEIVKQSVKLKNLPSSLHGYKIIHLSDIHCSSFIREDYLKRVVENVNHLKGDLIALTGDYIIDKDDRKYFPELIKTFSQLDSKYQKLAVLGNHDFWTDPQFIEEGLHEAGFKVLRNESITLTQNEQSFYIVGIDDICGDKHDIIKATEGIPLNEFSILLCHNPDYIVQAADYHFNLMLSGHTHGGQVQLPFIGPLIVPSKFGRKYSQGLHKEKETYLYVNRGIGVIGIPIRFLCRPEITEITLVRA